MNCPIFRGQATEGYKIQGVYTALLWNLDTFPDDFPRVGRSGRQIDAAFTEAINENGERILIYQLRRGEGYAIAIERLAPGASLFDLPIFQQAFNEANWKSFTKELL